MGPLADRGLLRAMVYGGAVLGGGGGGSLASGLSSASEASRLGRPRLVSLNQVPSDAILATLSAIGSVDTSDALNEAHFDRAIEVFQALAERPVYGFIASEVGPRAVTYGLAHSARTGQPIVDAPCNGRAHPVSAMGSLGLHLEPGHTSVTVAVGGQEGSPDYLELAVRADVAGAGRFFRESAARSGALAVVRNALPATWVKKHAAVGALSYAARVGRVLLGALSAGPTAVLRALAAAMGGRVIGRGVVSEVVLAPTSGFTMGEIKIADDRDGGITLPTCNEFMSAIVHGQTAAAFPDLITVFDGETGLPLASSEVRARQPVAVFAVARQRLLLGSPMRDARLLAPIEEHLGVNLKVSKLAAARL
jgi:DUF917 family protein